jgi:hypothetical protein
MPCGGLKRAALTVPLLSVLLVLHRSDGGEVTIAAAQVTSLRAPAGPLHGLAPAGGCLVWMTDGKFVAVLEGCPEVRRRLESAGGRTND